MAVRGQAQGRALLYDGDYVRSFCAATGSFDYTSADDNQNSTSFRLRESGQPGLTVGDDAYTLDANCSIREL